LAAELLKTFEPDIETLTLIPSDHGRFEIEVNQKLVFSKAALHRHATTGEIISLVSQFLKEGNSK
jgi:selenoprotein W-related protein